MYSKDEDSEYEICWKCGGSGRTSRLQSYGAFNNWVNENCVDCKGKGKVEKRKWF